MISRDIYLRTHNTHSMPPAGTEPAIPASEWPQNHALESGATDIRFYYINFMKNTGKTLVGENISRVKYQIYLKMFQIIVNDFKLISVSYQIINFVFVELLYQDFVPYLVC
jgi:hypothetical protein